VVADVTGEGGGDGPGEQEAGRVDSDKEPTIRRGSSSGMTASPQIEGGQGENREGGGMCTGSSEGGGRCTGSMETGTRGKRLNMTPLISPRGPVREEENKPGEGGRKLEGTGRGAKGGGGVCIGSRPGGGRCTGSSLTGTKDRRRSVTPLILPS
jgi:hypothetical protein